MKKCIKCGSHAFNLYTEEIDQGGLCDVHYWQGRAHRAEALAQFDYRAVKTYHEGKPVYVSKPEQEPSITKTGCGILTLHSGWDDLPDGTKFYTIPPKRPWVGLTDEDYLNALDLHPYEGTDREFWKVLEAKLKEKNI